MINKNKAIGIIDVAKEANASTATVSRVLSGSGYPVSAQKRKDVLAAAEKLKYEPNIIGRILKTQLNPTIGIIIPTFHNPFFTQLVLGIEQEANEHGFFTMTVSSQRDQLLERKLIANFKNNNIKALLIASVDEEQDSLQRYIEYGGVVCVFESNFNDLTDVIHAQVDSLIAARKATKYLLDKGHTKIAYLTTPLSRASRYHRLNGIQLEMDYNTVPFGDDDIFISPHEADNMDGLVEFEVGKSLASDFLKKSKGHTAIIVANDMIAVGIMNHLQEQGKNIPEDISIISFDNIYFSECVTPPLTTMDLPSNLLGKRSCKVIIEAVTSKIVPKDIILSVASTLVERKTVKDLHTNK